MLMCFRGAGPDHISAAKRYPLSVAVYGVPSTSAEEGFDVHDGTPDSHGDQEFPVFICPEALDLNGCSRVFDQVMGIPVLAVPLDIPAPSRIASQDCGNLATRKESCRLTPFETHLGTVLLDSAVGHHVIQFRVLPGPRQCFPRGGTVEINDGAPNADPLGEFRLGLDTRPKEGHCQNRDDEYPHRKPHTARIQESHFLAPFHTTN